MLFLTYLTLFYNLNQSNFRILKSLKRISYSFQTLFYLDYVYFFMSFGEISQILKYALTLSAINWMEGGGNDKLLNIDTIYIYMFANNPIFTKSLNLRLLMLLSYLGK